MTQIDEVSRIDAESVRRIFADVLGVEIREDSSFLAQGGDSFHAVLVVARIEDDWGLEADFTDVLQSTPGELARALATAPRLS
ncbi:MULTISPECIES: phosphopantetheine-binding protein [unclassified Streptomyces]|uniref:phosphopantetheine-binding protein n=1 Tax=unclassified Streptomyces TaxID=2593676 RepID=UPI002257D0ED|nr:MULTISPECIES: phosphopantetheine-binding protein [unclassified Streptomyces]MCX4972728.1 phosphopantetheine-binding protein [Streptomyces sp. NBC_00620]WRZ20953.1 phosphopantetheine-binding protein [Streptomyces sp. NBC_00243]WUC12812.1 phosphopantetheine-binding protein [Streptomyces sp. NBC_00564]WUC50685.1 phosphopantetheine-binding protein [Streptomyces sp. NBC_00554]